MNESNWQERLGSVVQGRYRLKSFLARGGMGAVFLCEDLRLTGQVWAIKEMLSVNPLETPLVEEAFRREAEMLAGLRHESLPAIVDSFVEGTRHYLVMEYIAGVTLTRYLEGVGPLPSHQALGWGLELAEVLNYLHSQRPAVIFRDLKPDNVMVTEDQRLKLVDFGLARHFRPGKTRDTQAAGSIGYSPPEQWEDSDQTDERSDIYGWGAVLHFLLSAKPPSPVYGQQNLRQYRPDLEAGLEQLVLKCLAPDPTCRYADCRELILALKGLRTAIPTARKSPKWLPWLAMVGLLLAAGLGYTFTRSPQAPQPTLEMEQILQRTADIKSSLREKLESGQVASAIGPLQKLTRDYPQDGEAQVLLNNALVLQSQRPRLVIPVFSSTSGSEYEGVQMLNGLALAQRELNQQGVVDARRPQVGAQSIVLDYVNCDSRQELTLEGYLKAAARPEYALAIGPWSSQQLRIVAPILESAGFPTVAPTASDPGTSELGANCLTVADTDAGRVKALAGFFIDHGLRRAVVLRNEESVVGHSSAALFAREFDSLGGTTVAELGYLQETSDYSALVDRVAKVEADCVFMPEYRAGVVMTVTRQLRSRAPLRVGSLAAMYSHSPLESGQGLDGLVVCSYFFAQSPSVRDFTSRYQRFTGSNTPSHREANAYDSLYLIAQAIREVGFERAALREYLNSLGKTRPLYRGVSGEFSPRRHREMRQPYILEMRDGELRMLR